MAKEKPASKKVASKRPADTERDTLAKELKSLILKLDVEGLSFLVEQAKVHLYNMQVDEINQAEIAKASSTGSASGAGSKAAHAPAKTKASGDLFRIEGAGSGSSYYLVYKGSEWIMFSREEMGHMAALVHAGGTDLETRERLFNWLSRERGDVLSAIFVKDKFDDKLKALTALIKKNFKPGKS
ncbi:hypothetical protein [Leadbettera azotonutricia]|uniref:Uncharacterized protein n=1 Tax=Leadbettera azotonutricia (strain ATCC BAA-888 / DSM 13862 / ZAS-9) TaxID=545695 RepID=F5YFD9_LEAAZ|nr:hypothetical protein [Leadbettera azotonutricia]AEF83084.1 conserved hypothetical protein [Leadbettera azotonutricia ZAS-9]